MKTPLKIIRANPLHEEVKAYAASYCLSREKKIEPVELRRYASELVNAISTSGIKRGAKVIGHIKAYIEYETGFLHVNTVGESSDVTVGGRDGDPPTELNLVVNSIVYGLDEESLKEATEEAIGSVSLLFGFTRAACGGDPPRLV